MILPNIGWGKKMRGSACYKQKRKKERSKGESGLGLAAGPNRIKQRSV